MMECFKILGFHQELGEKKDSSVVVLKKGRCKTVISKTPIGVRDDVNMIYIYIHMLGVSLSNSCLCLVDVPQFIFAMHWHGAKPLIHGLH